MRGRRAWLAPGLILAASMASCSFEQIGLPRVALLAESPDGRFVAFVRNHPEIDPPSQSLWLQRVGEEPVRIEKLGADTDWCDQVVWSEDSSRVGFVVSDQRLRVVEAESGSTVFDERIVGPRDGTLPAGRVRGLDLVDNGAAARYRGCTRSGDCSPVHTLELRSSALSGRAG